MGVTGDNRHALSQDRGERIAHSLFSVRWLECLRPVDYRVRAMIRSAAQPPLAFSLSAAEAFARWPVTASAFR
jgi:hypothetical protein